MKLPEKASYGMQHFHLWSGGTTIVLFNTARALAKHSSIKNIEMQFFASLGEKGETGLCVEGAKIENFNIPKVGYREKPFKSEDDFWKESSLLAECLSLKMGLEECNPEKPYFLHVNNVSLGKSALVAGAIRLLAEKSLAEKKPLFIFNQIHDFAENLRPWLLTGINNCTGKNNMKLALSIMYPLLPNIFWLTINSFNLSDIRSVGAEEQMSFLFPNAVNIEKYSSKPLWKLSEKDLEEKDIPRKAWKKEHLFEKMKEFSVKNYSFSKDRKVLLAPVKFTPRKNVPESLLVLKAFNHRKDEFQLWITLAANSDSDIEYGDRVKKFFRKRKMPVVA